jgi:transcriptional regulator of acetoin/glycerol metabolism
MKIIVLGPPLTGKSTLAKYLRERNVYALDFDDELLKLNRGEWPGNDPELNSRLKTEVIETIITSENLVFFAFEFPPADLERARLAGFTVYQLVADAEELSRRNLERLKTQPDNDAFQYLEANLRQQADLRERGLVDHQLDATLPVADLAKLLLKI